MSQPLSAAVAPRVAIVDVHVHVQFTFNYRIACNDSMIQHPVLLSLDLIATCHCVVVDDRPLNVRSFCRTQFIHINMVCNRCIRVDCTGGQWSIVSWHGCITAILSLTCILDGVTISTVWTEVLILQQGACTYRHMLFPFGAYPRITYPNGPFFGALHFSYDLIHSKLSFLSNTNLPFFSSK